MNRPNTRNVARHLGHLGCSAVAATLLVCAAQAQAANGRNPDLARLRAQAALSRPAPTLALAAPPAPAIAPLTPPRSPN